MPHFRVDDALHSHPKAQRATDEALGLWVRAGSYCMAYLTDGFVPEWWVKQQPRGAAKAKKLVAAGLWHDGAQRDGERGYQFHEFTGVGRQDSRAQIEADREKWRKKKAGQRAASPGDTLGDSSGDVSPLSPRDTSGESPGESPYAGATRPRANPTQPNPKEDLSGSVEHASSRNVDDPAGAERGQERGRSQPVDPSASRLVATLIPANIPAAVKTSLRLAASQLIVGDQLPAETVAESLRRWATKPGSGPGLLAHIAADVVRERAGPAPGAGPSSKLRAWAELAREAREAENATPPTKAIEA